VTALIAATFLAFGSRPGQELALPFAIVMVGGVLAGAATTLFAIPVLYARLAGISVPAREPKHLALGEIAGPEPIEEIT
jgi:Cu/Ag efflux pump CusA